MPNLLDELAEGYVPLADDLHSEICRTCDEIAGSDEAKRKRLHKALVACIAAALLGDCGETLKYPPEFIADYVTGLGGLAGPSK